MEFFKQKTNIDFLGLKKYTIIFSMFIITISLFFIFFKGLRFGLDFTGGYQVQIKTNNIVQNNEIIQELLNKFNFRYRAAITSFGSNNFFIKFNINDITTKDLKNDQEYLKQNLERLLDAKVQSINYIGPIFGKELMSNGILASIISIICIFIYMSIRFNVKFSISACITLLHDPIIILGIFSAFQLEFNLITISEILAVIGYSLNNIVVIYNRIYENFIKIKNDNIIKIINKSINDTLSRTILTSGIIILVMIILYIFGGNSLHNFALVIASGIIVGTYSSIYIANVVAIYLGLDLDNFF